MRVPTGVPYLRGSAFPTYMQAFFFCVFVLEHAYSIGSCQINCLIIRRETACARRETACAPYVTITQCCRLAGMAIRHDTDVYIRGLRNDRPCCVSLVCSTSTAPERLPPRYESVKGCLLAPLWTSPEGNAAAATAQGGTSWRRRFGEAP